MEDETVELFDDTQRGKINVRANGRYAIHKNYGVVMDSDGNLKLPYEFLAKVGVAPDDKGNVYVSLWREMETDAKGVESLCIRIARWVPWLGDRRKVKISPTYAKVSVLQAYPGYSSQSRGALNDFPMVSKLQFPWFFKMREENPLTIFRYRPFLRTLSPPWHPLGSERGGSIDKVLEMQFVTMEINSYAVARKKKEEAARVATEKSIRKALAEGQGD